MVKGVTGLDLDGQDMKAIARNIADDTRRFNLREGLDPSDDRLPKRFHTEALPETGKVMSEADMEQLLADYYRARGWDENGRPPDRVS
jgi:aldehyde:ferredoxin oxidoreductase